MFDILLPQNKYSNHKNSREIRIRSHETNVEYREWREVRELTGGDVLGAVTRFYRATPIVECSGRGVAIA